MNVGVRIRTKVPITLKLDETLSGKETKHCLNSRDPIIY